MRLVMLCNDFHEKFPKNPHPKVQLDTISPKVELRDSDPYKPHWILIHTMKLCNPHSVDMGCQTWAPDGDTAATYHFGTRPGGRYKDFNWLRVENFLKQNFELVVSK